MGFFALDVSAIGTKRTCAGGPHMSALGGKAVNPTRLLHLVPRIDCGYAHFHR